MPLESHRYPPILRVDSTSTPRIAMAPYIYFALGATLLVGAGLFAIRHERVPLRHVSDEIDWL